MAGSVTTGTVVRVPLQGRRVRAWVVADGVAPATDPARLRPLAAVVSAGPPTDVVELTAWAAWRWCGPRTAFLRAASPPNNVAPSPYSVPDTSTGEGSETRNAAAVDADAGQIAREAVRVRVSVVRWPPADDVYELVAALASERGSTIVVLPDADRAIHLARRLGRAGALVALMSAQQAAADRTRAWSRAREGNCLVVGGRVAAWAPLPDLARVVVLDDGDEALQEERAPTWHAREVARERAGRVAGQIVLVSPAPSLETLASDPTVFTVSRTRERAGWPIVEVVDRRPEAPGLGLFSTRLVDALRAAVAGNGRAVCVLNRKGRARLLACDACGELARCDRCGAAVHEAATGLACAACGDVRPRVCSRCGATRMRVLSAGVTRVRRDLAALLGGVEIGEVDATTDPASVADAPVVVGTEAALHRVPSATLVAFLEFDQELLAARLRAAEQAMWLLVRAARLTGGRAAGRVLVQTRLPRHPVLESAVRADPAVLAAVEAPRRQLLSLPPFGAMAVLTGDAGALDVAAARLRTAGCEPGGRPDRLIVRAPSTASLADALAASVPPARAAGRLRVEVDPPRV